MPDRRSKTGGVMAEVSAESELFSRASDDARAVVFYAARHRPSTAIVRGRSDGLRMQLLEVLNGMSANGWRTSVAAMFGDQDVPHVYLTGFAHDVDLVGAFEAPDLATAYQGIELLLDAGWDRLFDTTWQVGRREFAAVAASMGRAPGSRWNMFALWEWNDGWQRASDAQRRAYDLECDEAFRYDSGSGVSIAGRHRLDAQSTWHHLGIWEAPTIGHVTRGIDMHEQVGDFKFTTSRHYIARSCPAADYFKEL